MEWKLSAKLTDEVWSVAEHIEGGNWMDNDIFGIYDESFDLNRDGKLDAVEFDYMMEEFDKAGKSTISKDDDSYLLDDDEDDDEDDCDDDDEEDSWEDSDDEDDWDNSDDDDWNDESENY